MLPSAFILIALLCWGLWGIFDKKALENSTSHSVIIAHYVLHVAQIPLLLFILSKLEPGWSLTPQLLLWSGLAAVVYVVATISYLTAMSKSDASFVLGTTACYPVISVILSVLLLGEKLVLCRILGVAVVCAGVAAISKTANNAGGQARIGRTVWLCIIAATVSWAIWGIIDKAAVSVAGPLQVCVAKYMWDAVLLPFIWLKFKRDGQTIEMLKGRSLSFCVASAVCLAVGAWSYLSAMTTCTASYVIAITACYPALMYVFAVGFLRERFTRWRAAGIFCIVIGGLLVQYSNPSNDAPQTARTVVQPLQKRV